MYSPKFSSFRSNFSPSTSISNVTRKIGLCCTVFIWKVIILKSYLQNFRAWNQKVYKAMPFKSIGNSILYRGIYFFSGTS